MQDRPNPSAETYILYCILTPTSTHPPTHAGMEINNESLQKRLSAIEEKERERKEEKDGEKESAGLFSRIMNSLDMESHDVEVGHMG